VVDDLNQAREAYERREWVAAYQALADLDSPEMRADDFSALATTAYLLGRRNDCVQALQRAFQAHLDARDDPAAARSALWLSFVLLTGGEPAVGGGWAARADRILDGIDGDVVERGYARTYVVFRHLVAGEHAEALDAARAVADYGQRYRDPDLLALALNVQGRLLTQAGQVREGVRLMDEAMVGLMAGEVSPIIAGVVYCALIEACVLVCDYGIQSPTAGISPEESRPSERAVSNRVASPRRMVAGPATWPRPCLNWALATAANSVSRTTIGQVSSVTFSHEAFTNRQATTRRANPCNCRFIRSAWGWPSMRGDSRRVPPALRRTISQTWSRSTFDGSSTATTPPVSRRSCTAIRMGDLDDFLGSCARRWRPSINCPMSGKPIAVDWPTGGASAIGFAFPSPQTRRA
jgi:hypothetical protein